MKPTGQGRWRGAGILAGVAVSLATSTVVCTFVGYYLDQRWGTLPWLTMLGLFLGLGAGFVEMFRLLKRFGRD